MKFNTLREVFDDQIKDLYSAEKQIVDALPKMIEAASDSRLKAALKDHLGETKNQLKRLEKLASQTALNMDKKVCFGMQGLLKEASEALAGKGEATDAAIVANAQRVEHYEMAGYGSASAFADELGLDDAATLLRETLKEEKHADQTLTKIAEDGVNSRAVAEAAA